MLIPPDGSPATIILEHPSGTIDVLVDYRVTNSGLDLNSAGLIRTARKLADGKVYVPATVWPGL